MSWQLISYAMMLGIIVLAVGLFLPTMISAPAGERGDTIEIGETETRSLERLNVTLDDANATTNEANLTLTDKETLESNFTSVTEGQTNSITLRGDTVNVTNNKTIDDTTARVTVERPHTYGWSRSTTLFGERLETTMALVGFILVVALVARGMV